MARKEGGELCSATLPDIRDLNSICQEAATMLKWWLPKERGSKNPQIVPADLQFLVDPALVLPQLRAEYTFTSESLKAKFTYSSNGLWIVSTIERIPQVEIQTITVKGMEETWETIIIVNPRERGLFNVGDWKFVDRMKITNPNESLSDSVDCPTPFPMIIVAWNARGIARFGFKENVKHLIREHTPDILILTEIKTSRDHAIKIDASLPFDRHELAEPNGFTGGILVLWNSTTVDFQSISVDLHAIHGIVQVSNKPFSFSFFLSAIYANPKFKARLENWCDLESIVVI